MDRQLYIHVYISEHTICAVINLVTNLVIEAKLKLKLQTVGATELTVRPEFKFQEFVSKFALMADIISQIKVIGRHGYA